MPGVPDVTQWIGAHLLVGSLQGGLVVGLVWLVCRIDVIPAATRATLWWLASFALVLALVPVPGVPLPVLRTAQTNAGDVIPAAPATKATSTEVAEQASGLAGGASALGPLTWTGGALALWLLAVGLQAAWLIAAHLRLGRVIAQSVSPAGDVSTLTARLARRIGLRGTPGVRMSSHIQTPQAVRCWRPLILMPAAVSFTRDELTMALCRELVHIRRGDLALGWVPAVAQRLFFFHPLAHLAAREYVVAREAACDAGVLRALGVEPGTYAQLLVRFGIAATEPSVSAAGSSTSSSCLRRRLAMLERISSTGAGRRAAWCAIAAVIATSLPVKLVARPGAVMLPPVGVPAIQLQLDNARVEPTAQFFLRALEESKQRLAELEAERQNRLSQLREQLAKQQAEREAAKLELLLDTMKRTAEASPQYQNPNTAILDAIEAHSRRLAEQATPPEGQLLAERLRGEMESLRAQVAKLEEQRETLLAQQQALVAAQQRLSAEVDKLSVLMRQLEAGQKK
jgi:beta-lactamase regulating signal transducer with metallopeptidase domain